MARELSANNLAVGDSYDEPPYTLWGGDKITVWVLGSAVYLQLSATQPPDPPAWESAIYMPAGSFARATSFGRFRFRNAVAGETGLIHFSASAGTTT